MVAVEDANVKILDSVEEGFEVTIKELIPLGLTQVQLVLECS